MLQSKSNTQRKKQAGSALLMVVFMVATMLLLTSTAILRIDTQGRREREAELAWRGEQYQRAIGMYFRKFGKYPTKIEDLVKQTNGVRFLRQAYPDPMNKTDGSWRFIYVGPSGQLIGSLRHTSLLQSLVSTPTLPGASPLSSSSLTTPGTSPTSGPGGATGSAASPFSPIGQQSTSQGLNQFGPMGAGAQPQPLQGAVIGGNIIGVASKMKELSLRVYRGGDTYETWEFIWNPQTQIAIPSQGANPLAPPAPTTGPAGAPSTNGLTPGQLAPGPLPQGGQPTQQPPTDTQGGGTPQPQNPPGQ